MERRRRGKEINIKELGGGEGEGGKEVLVKR